MANENAILELNEDMNEVISLDELEERLDKQLEEELTDMQFLIDEKEKIGSVDNLGKIIRGVVWEQFLNQVAVTAGEDFIRENRGLHLDLSEDAHIQTTENFEEGKIATHNTEIDYQKRYEDWQDNFQNDPNIEHKEGNYRYNEDLKVWEKHDKRSDSWKKVLNKDARSDFDKDRPKGSTHENMDEVISVAEQIRDPAANAHLTKKEQVDFDNSEKNLQLLDSSANQSKGDSTMSEWLDSERDGEKPADRFNINEEELRKKDKEARKEWERVKKKGEERSIAAGKLSRRKEAFRIGGKALRTTLMTMLADLVKKIISKMINWFKSSKKTLKTLLESLKQAIHSFIKNMKKNLINAGNAVVTTVATAIVGPVIGTIKKAWMLLKQGWNSLKNAVKYIKDPANKGKSFGILMMEVGKIVIAGLTAGGAIILGEVIEKSLMTIPIFAFEIPLLGSLANILGIFLGAVVVGIIGAIAINLIEKQIEKRMRRENTSARIDKGNTILILQRKLQEVGESKLVNTKSIVAENIGNRHNDVAKTMADATERIEENCSIDEKIQKGLVDNDNLISQISQLEG